LVTSDGPISGLALFRKSTGPVQLSGFSSFAGARRSVDTQDSSAIDLLRAVRCIPTCAVKANGGALTYFNRLSVGASFFGSNVDEMIIERSITGFCHIRIGRNIHIALEKLSKYGTVCGFN